MVPVSTMAPSTTFSGAQQVFLDSGLGRMDLLLRRASDVPLGI